MTISEGARHKLRTLVTQALIDNGGMDFDLMTRTTEDEVAEFIMTYIWPEIEKHEQERGAFLRIISSERQRWHEIRQYARTTGDTALYEAMDAATKNYGERGRRRPR